MRVLILHGPNLNRLGLREIKVYGSLTLDMLNKRLMDRGKEWGMEVVCHQSNSEGELIDHIHDAENVYDHVIFNPGAYAHYSFALRDAISSVTLSVTEVHISHIYAREEFRHHSVLSSVCEGQITGFGWMSYEIALWALKLKKEQKVEEYVVTN